jgi:hypothetical protein
MNTYTMTVSPLDDAQSVDQRMLALLERDTAYGQFRTETDLLILRTLECSRDEYGDENPDYWDNLNL